MRELERMHPAAATLLECDQRKQQQQQHLPSQTKTEGEEEEEDEEAGAAARKRKKKPRASLSSKKAKPGDSTSAAAVSALAPFPSLAVLVDSRPWNLARIDPGVTALPAAQGAEGAGVMGKDALSARDAAAAARAAASAAGGDGDGVPAGGADPFLLPEGVTLTAFGCLAKLAAALERAASCAPSRAGGGGGGGGAGAGPQSWRGRLDPVAPQGAPARRGT